MILILTLYCSSQADIIEFQWHIFYFSTIPVTIPASLCCRSWEPRHDLLLPSWFFQLILNTLVAKAGKQLSPTTLYSPNSGSLCANCVILEVGYRKVSCNWCITRPSFFVFLTTSTVSSTRLSRSQICRFGALGITGRRVNVL